MANSQLSASSRDAIILAIGGVIAIVGAGFSLQNGSKIPIQMYFTLIAGGIAVLMSGFIARSEYN